MADSPVSIQAIARPEPSTPSWFGEAVLLTAHLRKQGVLTKISEQVRFARRRFGRYDVIDFVAVLFGYAVSGERTLAAFYERLWPFANAFMALFGRDRLPSRSALSRFLAALTAEPVEALRTLFLSDLLARSLGREQQSGGLALSLTHFVRLEAQSKVPSGPLPLKGQAAQEGAHVARAPQDVVNAMMIESHSLSQK